MVCDDLGDLCGGSSAASQVAGFPAVWKRTGWIGDYHSGGCCGCNGFADCSLHADRTPLACGWEPDGPEMMRTRPSYRKIVAALLSCYDHVAQVKQIDHVRNRTRLIVIVNGAIKPQSRGFAPRCQLDPSDSSRRPGMFGPSKFLLCSARDLVMFRPLPRPGTYRWPVLPTLMYKSTSVNLVLQKLSYTAGPCRQPIFSRPGTMLTACLCSSSTHYSVLGSAVVQSTGASRTRRIGDAERRLSVKKAGAPNVGGVGSSEWRLGAGIP
ncbi:hypothetical protein GE09DRAFT_359196 [Coniochaeta sp. 2T2.1]|nr:hypothetical protein GE09DRAFT_359196 [Coniochaeta sp. 2T2.1]